MKKKPIIITAGCIAIVATLLLFCFMENDIYRLEVELRKTELERNALSDAIRCYADNEETLILDYASEFLDIADCCDSLELWANVY